MFVCPIFVMMCSVYWVPASSAVSMPSVSSCCRALVTWGLGLLSAMRCMPAFSKKGLYRAMTAYVSMQGVPAWVSVSATSFVPNPMLRYFGWIITRLMVMISCWSWCSVPFQVLWRPKQMGGG